MLNYYVRQWLDTVANCRIHATTQMTPFARLAEEQAYLQAMAPPYSGLPAQQVPDETAARRYPSLDFNSMTFSQHDLGLYDTLLKEETA